jgi:hypothetical protein
MRSLKSSRRILVQGVEYRWQATGNDGYITIGIWPVNNIGPFIRGSFNYHETWINNRDGSSSSARDQIVITNRIIRRIIEHAIIDHHYDPTVKGEELNLKVLDGLIKWDDAVRADNDSR